MYITSIYFECIFSQSTSIGGLSLFEGELHHYVNDEDVI